MLRDRPKMIGIRKMETNRCEIEFEIITSMNHDSLTQKVKSLNNEYRSNEDGKEHRLSIYVSQQHEKQEFIKFTVAAKSSNISNALKQILHQEHE